MGIEDPGPDVAEQQLPVVDLDEDDEEVLGAKQPPLEADPADVADQQRVVPVVDEDNLSGW
jgi:hypothetical protein